MIVVAVAALASCGSVEVAAAPHPRLIDGQAVPTEAIRHDGGPADPVAQAPTVPGDSVVGGASLISELTVQHGTAPPSTAVVLATTTNLPTSIPAVTTAVTEANQSLGPGAGTRAEVLSMISYPWQQTLPGWTIEFLPGRPGYLGYTWILERRIEIYARASQSAHELAFTLAHELGHAVDVTLFHDAERAAWLEARGLVNVPWWPGGARSDFSSGCGDWAEAFAVWQLGGTSMSELAGQPDRGDLALVAQLVQA